jgi:hypothetical protein
VLARIVEGNFEHEGAVWLRGVERLYLYSREYVTHDARNCWRHSRVASTAAESGLFCPTNRYDRTRAAGIAYVLNPDDFPPQKTGRC